MIRIHPQGNGTITVVGIFLSLLNLLGLWLFPHVLAARLFIGLATICLMLFILQFFRYPKRLAKANANEILSPADGHIVAIEELTENEHIKGKCIQVSIFMSAWNVHINWIPFSGTISYYKYHSGKYLLAANPKSSELNERSSTVIKHANGKEVLMRQIAGFVARRVVNYLKTDDMVEQGKELGFIKFGSRVDLFFPLDTDIKVALNDKVRGVETVIAEFGK